MSVKYGSKLVSALILLTVILNFNNVFLPLKIIYYLRSANSFALLLVAMGLSFLLINLVAAVGLYCLSRWSFVTTYVAIIFSTVIFSASYIPYFPRLFPAQYAFAALVIANVSVLGFVIYLQMLSRPAVSGTGKSRVGKRVTKRKK